MEKVNREKYYDINNITTVLNIEKILKIIIKLLLKYIIEKRTDRIQNNIRTRKMEIVPSLVPSRQLLFQPFCFIKDTAHFH